MCYTERVYKASNFFPKYTFYTIKSSLTLAYYFGQDEDEMKLCLMILSVPWYMLNELEQTAILSHFLTFITGSSSRVSTIHTTF